MRLARGQRSIRSMSSTGKYNLEKPAAEMAAYLAQGPGLSELPLDEVRKSLEGAQAGVPMPDVDEAWITVPAMHDFMMLAVLRDSETTHAAMSLAASTFRRAFGTDHSEPGGK
jgi:hypothetical protein